MAVSEQRIDSVSGIPLGGIGAGSVEIRDDGLFHEWQIVNLGQWSPESPLPACDSAYPAGSDITPEGLVFALRTEQAGGDVRVRWLALREQLLDLYNLPWLKCVQGIRFRGEFPVARLEYLDDTLPVQVSAEVFAPFVPHDPRASATPGFYVRFSVKSLAPARVQVSLLGVIANPIPSSKRIHTVSQDGDATLLTLGADDIAEDSPLAGSITFGVKGGSHSYLTGAYARERRSFDTYGGRGPYGQTSLSYLKEFRAAGKLTNLTPLRALDLEAVRAGEGELTTGQAKRLLEMLLEQSFFYHKYERIRRCDPDLVEGEEQLFVFLKDAAKEADIRSDWLAPEAWRHAVLCATTEVGPQEEVVVLFTVGWFFPNHISANGQNIGHVYQHWFQDSAEVCRRLVAQHDELRQRTLDFADTLFDTTLDYMLADSVSAQLSTLVKTSWWSKEGDFGVWEGLGCCGLHTTDISYDGSFSIAVLFPELQLRQMQMTANFQLANGLVPHMFSPDLTHTDDQFDRVDLNPQFVLLVARDHLWTGDRKYLAGMWQPVVRAIESMRQLDSDGDGLPDTGCRKQTYDSWHLSGCPSYIASLWLAALKAGAWLAQELGEQSHLQQWQEWYTKGVANFEQLWNGEYYVLWKEMESSGRVDECCMSDQLDGDWFVGLLGWEPVLPRDRIAQALRSIFRYNYSSETGLRNATYPPGRKPGLSTFENVNAEATWTGIEYAIASMCIDQGLVTEGIEIARNVYDRYLRAGRVWDHTECGSHYYRAMSSWALLLSLSGCRIDATKSKLTFAPALEQPLFRVPFVTTTAWGSYQQARATTGNSAHLHCKGGQEAMRTLVLGLPFHPDRTVVTRNGETISCRLEPDGPRTRIEFDETVIIHAGDQLVIMEG